MQSLLGSSLKGFHKPSGSKEHLLPTSSVGTSEVSVRCGIPLSDVFSEGHWKAVCGKDHPEADGTGGYCHRSEKRCWWFELIVAVGKVHWRKYSRKLCSQLDVGKEVICNGVEYLPGRMVVQLQVTAIICLVLCSSQRAFTYFTSLVPSSPLNVLVV